MPGGRFASVCIAPYETAKVWTNCCNAAASVTIAGASLCSTSAPTFSINISNSNVCIACSTTLATGTFDYTCMGALLVTNTGASDGYTCFSGVRCCCFEHLTYVTNTGVSNTANAWICQSFYRDYYFPTPYPAATVIGNTNYNTLQGVAPCNICSYTAVISGNTTFLVNISCYCCGAGVLPASCFYCGLVVTCVGQNCAAASCVSSCLGLFGTRETGMCNTYGNFTAVDYWSTSKPLYSFSPVAGVAACVTGLIVSIFNCCIHSVSCIVCLCSCPYSSKGIVCVVGGGSFCCACISPATPLFGSIAFCDIPNCFCGCILSCRCCFADMTYPVFCVDIVCSHKFLMAGCNLWVGQNPILGVTIFRANCVVLYTAGMPTSIGCIPPSAGCWVSSVGPGLILCTCTGTPSNYGGDLYPVIKWLTYNHINRCNTFMVFNCCTPLMNGIYTVNSTSMSAIATLSTATSNNTLISYCCNPSNFYCTSICSFNYYFTKVSDVPACWCAIGARNLSITTPVAISTTEFVVYAGDLSCGLTNCLFRYTSPDLVNWQLTSNSSYTCALSSTCFIVGNTSTISTVTSNYETCLYPSGTLEVCTCAKNIERTGVVVSNGDSVYVRNYSNVGMAVNIWGYTES